MSGNEHQDSLAEGRQLLEQAARIYERPLSPREYWFLGAGLAACTLAEMEEKGYAVGRIEQLMDRLGYRGVQGDWLQRFVEELANLNAEGLLWPVYERSPAGPMEPTGLEVHPGFDAQAGYSLALAHLGVAAALAREDSATVEQLAEVIADLVENGWKPEHEPVIMAALNPGGEEEGQP
ncbi:MAG: hypothetical protein ACOY93_20260 [Bacillota bacterium]